MKPPVSVPRTLEHRIAQMVVADGGVRHVPVEGSAYPYAEGVTLCGLEFVARDGHDSLGHLPLAEVECVGCREAALLIPFRHATTWSRVRRGSGPVRGQGTRYATTWSCTCGEGGRVNMAPSAGGQKWVTEDADAHLDAVAGLPGAVAS